MSPKLISNLIIIFSHTNKEIKIQYIYSNTHFQPEGQVLKTKKLTQQ